MGDSRCAFCWASSAARNAPRATSRRRRAEGIPVLQQKARDAFAAHYGAAKAAQLMDLFAHRPKLEAMPVHEFVSAFVK